MSDYMKSYINRNRRRRSANKRRNDRKNKNVSWKKMGGVGLGIALIAVVALLSIKSSLPSAGDKQSKDTVTGSEVSVVPSDGVKADDKASPIPDTGSQPTAIPGEMETPAVTRQPESTVMGPGAEASAVPTEGVDASFREMTTSGSSVQPTAMPGGISEAVASVNTISPKAIAEPTPRPRSRAVALTFDDGPDTENTPKILAILKKYNAHATFFVVGNRVASRANCLKQVVAQGSEIGNHSWDHSNLSLAKMKTVNKQYDKTASVVKKLTGYQITFMRPPYGAISDTMRKKLKHPMVLWSIDTLDWKTRNAKSVYKNVRKNVSDGDIVLMHDIHASTIGAVEKIVPWLVKHDYDIVTVSELMKRKGIKMKNGKAYGSAR
ncbi:MAG: polysaccharide deacetylase family protein [Lachnospiraceae bacterium]|nr:polysaccharide deacetylase family protein [Lachnospiraceae bacterium]